MRACQHCGSAIPTAAKTCEECGKEQLATVGGDAARSYPEVNTIAEANDLHDHNISRFILMILVSSAILISIISGVSFGSLVAGTSTFFVALLALYILFQVAGIDVSI